MSQTVSDTYADLGGSIADPPDGPECHWRCDGVTGLTRDPDPLNRIPVACPVHRPFAAQHVGRGRRRQRVLAT